MAGLTLPQAPWRHRAGLDDLCDVLGASDGAVRFVGGAVRDALLGIDVADIDLATTRGPDRVLALLRKAGIKGVPTGLAHGTITAVLPGGPIEVTTLRRDISTDGRHAVVAYTDDWREDAARRDFTMNALYADPLSGAIHDYFGGLDDLAAGRVRFIGDPLQRIAEDHLRILRFFRFHARFGDAIDDDGLRACAARANDLMALSRERIAAELLRLLVARHAAPVIALMVTHAILRPVLPEIDAAGAERFATLVARERESGIDASAIRRLAALLPPEPTLADSVGARLKLSNLDRRRLISAVTPAGDDAPRGLAYRLGSTLALDRLLLSERPIADAQAVARWQPPALPLTGGAIVERGVKRGPEVARLLRAVEERWIAEGFPPVERAAQLADEIVAAWRRDSSNA